MIKLLARGFLVLLGAALTVITVQHALKIDGSAATQPVTGRTEPGDRGLRRLGQALFGTSEDDTADTGDATTPVRTDRTRPATPPVNGVGTFNERDQQSNVSADPDTGAGTQTVAELDSRPPTRLGEATGGGSATDPVRVGPATTTQAGHGCKHELGLQPQGVTADVDFVGVLLNGSEREGRDFSGAQLGDLKILVQWRNLFQNHGQRLDLIAPDGSLYRSLSRPLTATDGDAPVQTLLPVNGTWITRYGLYGAWCVEVFFDQDESPIASSRLVISAQR
jgi:hypothetical protein